MRSDLRGWVKIFEFAKKHENTTIPMKSSKQCRDVLPVKHVLLSVHMQMFQSFVLNFCTNTMVDTCTLRLPRLLNGWQILSKIPRFGNAILGNALSIRALKQLVGLIDAPALQSQHFCQLKKMEGCSPLKNFSCHPMT